MKAPISSDKVPVAAGPYSPGLTVGELIFLSGQGAASIRTRATWSATISSSRPSRPSTTSEAVLEAAGASLDDVVSCLVHLVDLGDFPAFNAVYEQKFGGVKPVRTTVRADLVAGLLGEITVVARTSWRARDWLYMVIWQSLARAWRTDLPRVVLLLQVGLRSTGPATG